MGIGVIVAGGTRKPKIEDVVTGLLAGTVSPTNACKCDNCLMALLETRRRCLGDSERTALLRSIERRLNTLWGIRFCSTGYRAVDKLSEYDVMLARLAEAQAAVRKVPNTHDTISDLNRCLERYGVWYNQHHGQHE